LRRLTDRLKRHPLSGQVVPELHDPELREIVFGAFRIVYRIQEERIDVLTVYHGARLLGPQSE
jgi:toxin ParE1/3/4